MGKKRNKNSPKHRPVRRKTFPGILQLIRLFLFTFGLLTILILFELLTAGLPSPLIRAITTRVSPSGTTLQIDAVRLSPNHGWVLNNVQLYNNDPDDLHPVVQAKKLYLFLWPAQGDTATRNEWSLSIRGKNIDVSPGLPWQHVLLANSPLRTIDQLNAAFSIRPGRISIQQSSLIWGGLHLQTRGNIFLSKSTNLPANQSVIEGKNASFILKRAATFGNLLNKLQFGQPPEITIDFDVDTAHPERAVLNATILIKSLLWDNQTYRGFSSTLQVQNQELSLSSAQLILSEGKQLDLSGTYQLPTGIAELHIQNTLPATDLLNLLPLRIRSELDGLEITATGPAVFDATLGPAAAGQLLEQIRANILILQASRKDLTIDPLKFRFIRNGDQLQCDTVSGRVNGSPLEGRFDINLASKQWSAKVQTQSNPTPVGTLTGGGLQSFIQRFSFPGELPKANLRLSNQGVEGSLVIEGTLAGKNFSCGGVALDMLETPMNYSNGVLRLSALHASRDSQEFNGSIEIDFSKQLAQFDASTDFDPQTIARVLAPDHPTILTNITFGGPVYCRGSGQVDYSGGTNHAFRGTLSAARIAVKQIETAQFKTDIEGRADQLLFSNSSFLYCNGRVEGSAAFDMNLHDDSAPYRINIRASEIDFARLLRAISTGEIGRTSGILSGTFDFSADGAQDFWTSVNGAGQIEIEEGNLRTLHIMDGFTRLIQTPIPGFNLFSITTGFANFQLTGSKLSSENIQLGGTLLSAKAHGSYSPEKGLNFVVRAEPLRETRDDKKWYQLHLWGADALKWGTTPFFDLFDFKLEGSLHDPQWRMLSLPKELYHIMYRESEKPSEGPLLQN